MEFGILGLELSGKSTVFALLTGQHAPHAHGRREAHRGVAHVPDARLTRLAELYSPRKVVPATVEFVDVPAVTRGGSAVLNLPELRTMDGLAIVVRAFPSETVPHPEGEVGPARDIELLDTELLLADLAVADARLERLSRELGKRRAAELEAERAALEKCRPPLAAGTPLREVDLSAEEASLLKGFAFLTRKPLLIVLNVGEDDVADLAGAPDRAGLGPLLDRPGIAVCPLCATLEEEISRLSPTDQVEFLRELGLPDRALDRVLHAAYDLLGLISFLTVGEDECRAWSIPAGTPAVRAAGAIHSDLEKGFIRAEVVPWQELLDAGSMAACRQRGTLRLEGKEYPVRDGDVLTIRFNV